MGCESYVRAVARQFSCLGMPTFITCLLYTSDAADEGLGMPLFKQKTAFDIDLGRVYERFDASELDGDALGALWCHSGRSFGP